jgi:hypothetical protein
MKLILMLSRILYFFSFATENGPPSSQREQDISDKKKICFLPSLKEQIYCLFAPLKNMETLGAQESLSDNLCRSNSNTLHQMPVVWH